MACAKDEKPRHRVEITKGFWLGQTEVTVEAYQRFAKAKSRKMPNSPVFNLGWKKTNHSIVNIVLSDARAYCAWAVDGRLPSEAEWEYAARGGEDEIYPWGEKMPSCQKAAQNGAKFLGCGQPGSEPVASYGASNKLYDMAGNVWEWCEDSWHASYLNAPKDGSAWMQGTSDLGVFRGGSWRNNKANLRVSSRGNVDTEYRNNNVGFRCVHSSLP
jgi:formylglycine-generating enzyme required for sulfatase activity